MRYELRTRFSLPNTDATAGTMGQADELLEWLDDSLSAGATLGVDIAPRQWLGNRYTELDVVFELVTRYRNVFAATADQRRIQDVVDKRPALLPEPEVSYEVLRVYGDTEMLNVADPTKKMTHPSF